MQLLVPSFGHNGSSKDLLCTAVPQKNYRPFLFFAAYLAQGWRRPVRSRRWIWSRHLSVQHNAEGKDFSVYRCHPERRFVAFNSFWLYLALTDCYSCWYWRPNDVFVLGANFGARLRPAGRTRRWNNLPGESLVTATYSFKAVFPCKPSSERNITFNARLWPWQLKTSSTITHKLFHDIIRKYRVNASFKVKVNAPCSSADTQPLFSMRHLIPLAGCCRDNYYCCPGLPTVESQYSNFTYSLYTIVLSQLHAAFCSSVCICSQPTLLLWRGRLLVEWLVLQLGYVTLLLEWLFLQLGSRRKWHRHYIYSLEWLRL